MGHCSFIATCLSHAVVTSDKILYCNQFNSTDSSSLSYAGFWTSLSLKRNSS